MADLIIHLRGVESRGHEEVPPRNVLVAKMP